MQRFFKSSVGVSLGLGLGRIIPPNLGYFFATIGAKFLVRRMNSPMVRAVQSNQIVVRGQQTPADEIKIAVEEVFIHAGRCFVDLYHNLQDPISLKRLSPLTPRLQQLISQSYYDSPGAFIVAPHLSNFDLVLLAAAYRGLKAQVLTYGNPTGGYKIQNDIRSQTGLDITPVSPQVHKQAIQNMRNGGFVITAVDRPVRSKKQVLNFFGYPSTLPAGHIRMAVEANVPIIVAAAQMQADQLYHLNISDPIELVKHLDPDEEIRINGEAVLRVIESFIRKTPGQWLMYYPVWL
ncbi:MAG: lysophospholipid acyltransferase family protein [Anaerolineales bacterium]